MLFLEFWRTEVQQSNPDFTNIEISTVEKYVEDEPEGNEGNTRIIFQNGAWVDD